MSYGLMLLICIFSFLVWLGSLIVLIVVKKNDGAPPEIVRLRKRVKVFNLILISSTVFSLFIFFIYVVGFAMVVLSVFCIIDSIKLLKLRSLAQPQFGQQNYPEVTQQQAYGAQQQLQQTQQAAKCPHCGGENAAGSYFCVHCGKKI